MQNDIATLKSNLAISYKVKIHLSYDAEIPLLGI